MSIAETAFTIIRIIGEAIAERTGIVVLYEHDDEVSARVVWPMKLREAKGGSLTVYAFDSLREEYRSFRVDRIRDAHPLRGPP
jgi:predicted DNA-binding transcriptional regulator YafY